MTSETLAHRLGASPFVAFLGVRFDIDEDRVTATMPFRDELIGNPLVPALHGGSTASLLEIAAVARLMIETEMDALPKPVDLSFDYLRSGRPEDVFAEARIARLGSRVANVQAQAWQADRAEPIATLHGHFLLPSPR